MQIACGMSDIKGGSLELNCMPVGDVFCVENEFFEDPKLWGRTQGETCWFSSWLTGSGWYREVTAVARGIQPQ